MGGYTPRPLEDAVPSRPETGAKKRTPSRSRIDVGWREWAGLPELGVDAVKAKIDTGARTSSLHAFDLETFKKGTVLWTRFRVHPIQRKATPEIVCTARVLEMRRVRSSSGHVDERPVIETTLTMGDHAWPIELTLASRDAMGFRMLLGRQALRGQCVIDPGRSFVASKRPKRKTRKKTQGTKTHRNAGRPRRPS